MQISRGRVLAGALTLIACLEYFIAEAVAATAWHDPPYSYARNFISDLGMPGCGGTFGGRVICSPLFRTMNASFLLEGLLVVVATLLLAPLLTGAVWRRAVVALALLHAIGDAMVGTWHAGEAPQGGLDPHLIGAILAIIGGNLAIMAAGLGARRAGAPIWFAISSVALGLLGLAGVVALSTMTQLPPGFSERIAVDTISVWKVTTGLILVAALLRASTQGSRTDLQALGQRVRLTTAASGAASPS